MPLSGPFKTVFSDAVVSSPTINFARNLLIVGTSNTGNYMEPTYVSSLGEVLYHYTSGTLVQSAREAYNAGCRNLYLMRINNDGEDLSKEQIYERLTEAYKLLNGFYSDIVMLSDVYYDDEIDFASQLVEFLYTNQRPTIGVMAVKPIGDEEENVYVENLISGKRTFDIPGSNGIIDGGAYLSVVAAEPIFNYGNYNEYSSNGAAVYAGLISSLEANYSTTNKTLYGVGNLNISFSDANISELRNNGFITFSYNKRKGYVPLAGITHSNISTWTNLTRIRICNEALCRIYHVCEDFIGEPAYQYLSDIEASIRDQLDNMLSQGKMSYYNIEVRNESPTSDEVEFLLEILPVGEISSIQTMGRFEL